ncbi:MAG: hypothetical protein ACUVWY_03160 [Desulfosoma sp.]|uniref:hypothetical protein n=1 Tax=Desulfosoma sp. TaxID=2603217 RepID=UPI00404AEB02
MLWAGLIALMIAHSPGAATITVPAKLGRSVHVALPVQRAALVATEELIRALNLWDQVVSVSRWAQEGCDIVKAWVERYRHLKKPAVGQGTDVNLIAVLGVRPQLVITWGVYPSSVRFLENEGFPPSPSSLKALANSMRPFASMESSLARNSALRKS